MWWCFNEKWTTLSLDDVCLVDMWGLSVWLNMALNDPSTGSGTGTWYGNALRDVILVVVFVAYKHFQLRFWVKSQSPLKIITQWFMLVLMIESYEFGMRKNM